MSGWGILRAKKARRLLLIGLLAGGCLWLWHQAQKEPVYAGRPADQWLLSLANNLEDTQAHQAFTSLGARSLPCVKKALARHDSRLKQTVMGWDASVSWLNLGLVEARRWRLGALNAIRALGPTAQPLLPDLMASFADDRVVTPIYGFRGAFVALGSNCIPAFVPALGQGNLDEDQQRLLLDVWRELLETGQKADAPEAIPVLVAALRRTSPGGERSSLACGAALLLGAMGRDGAGAVDALIVLSESADPSGRAAALSALGRIGQRLDVVIPVLARALRHPQSQKRLAAAQALAALGPAARPAVLELGSVVNDPVADVAVTSLNVLRKLDTTRLNSAQPVAALQSPHRMVRIAAARLLAGMPQGAAQSVPALISALADEEPGVRIAATWSLGRLGPAAASAVEPLAQALPLAPEAVQVSIIECLGKMGPRAHPAVEAIRLAWSNNQAALRRSASEALLRIEGETWQGE